MVQVQFKEVYILLVLMGPKKKKKKGKNSRSDATGFREHKKKTRQCKKIRVL